TWSVMNWSHSDQQQSDAEQVALVVGGAVLGIVGGLEATAAGFSDVDKAEIEGAIIGAVGAVLATVGGIIGLPTAHPSCDGEIFTRVRAFGPGELSDSSDGPITETVRSPSKCGNDPHTTTIYGIRAAPFPLLGDDRLRLPEVSVIHPRSDEGAVSLYVIGSDGRAWSTFWPGTQGSVDWAKWFPVGDKTFPQGSPVSVIHPRSDEGAVSLYVIGPDGKVWSTFWPVAARS